MKSDDVVDLETADASVTTATVTIKALQVGRKQMTISVFRQLPESPLIDEEKVELLGQPWGYVNYRWGDQKGTHFIFQKGSRLYRNCFLVRDSGNFADGDHPSGFSTHLAEAEKIVRLYVYSNVIKGDIPDWYDPYNHRSEYNLKWERRGFEGCTFKLKANKDLEFVMDAYKSRWFDHESENAKEHLEMAKQNLIKEIEKECGGNVSLRVIDMVLDEMGASLVEYRSRWDKLMEKLRAVDQLYIAV